MTRFLSALVLAFAALSPATSAGAQARDVFQFGDPEQAQPAVWSAHESGVQGWGGLFVTDSVLGAVIRGMARRSAFVGDRVRAVHGASYPTIVTTFAHLSAFDSTIVPGESFTGPGITVHYLMGDSVVMAVVGVDFEGVRRAQVSGVLTARQAQEDRERLLVHELAVHVGSVAMNGPRRGCKDPRPGSWRMGCSVVEENLAMRDLGWTDWLRRMHAENALFADRGGASRHPLIGTTEDPVREVMTFIGPLHSTTMPYSFHDAIERLVGGGWKMEAGALLDQVADAIARGTDETRAFFDGYARAILTLEELGVQYGRATVEAESPLGVNVANMTDEAETVLGAAGR